MRSNAPGGIRVLGYDTSRVGSEDSSVVASERLGHGDDPADVLVASGWQLESPISARLSERGELELAYAVSPLSGIRTVEPKAVARDEGLAPDATGEPYQRVSAYAVVESDRGLLLTEFTSATRIAGSWGLPGGGLDDGEDPVDGVHREVWEETGQRIELGELMQIQSEHWIGRSPAGVVEDFHAIRIVYAATCPEPTEVVVHDIGGTTADAAWVPRAELADLPIVRSWRSLLR